MAIANIVKSTLGPIGLDKMLVRARGAWHRALPGQLRPASFPFTPPWPSPIDATGVQATWRASGGVQTL